MMTDRELLEATIFSLLSPERQKLVREAAELSCKDGTPTRDAGQTGKVTLADASANSRDPDGNLFCQTP